MPLPALSLVGDSCSANQILGLPLGESQAKRVIARCSQAPFGRGEETLVDTSVRLTWQLNPDHFTIGNQQWEEQLQALLSSVKRDLGCPDKGTVTCELYKCLLYETGGFFKVSSNT